MVAADKLGCSSFELMNRPDGPLWRQRALLAMRAEGRAQTMAQKRAHASR